MNYDVGTWRATLSPFVILTTEGRKDLGSIAQPEVDVTEILHSVQDDKMVESSWRATFLFLWMYFILTQRRKDTESYYLRFIEFTEVSFSLSNTH